MNKKWWKWINFLLFSGLWTEPMVLVFLLWLIPEIFPHWAPSFLTILSVIVLSFLPSGWIFAQNLVLKEAGKSEWGIEDIFHRKPTEYQSDYQKRAMYPTIPDEILTDKPNGIILGRVQTGLIKKNQQYIAKPVRGPGSRDGKGYLVVGGTGSGKTSCIIVNAILSSPGIGLFCLDIKGEIHYLSKKTGSSDTVIIEPRNRTSGYGWDAFFSLNKIPKEKRRERDIKEAVENIVNCLIPIKQDEKDSFWKESAKALCMGLMIGLIKKEDKPNLASLIDKILQEEPSALVKQLFEVSGITSLERRLLSSYVNMASDTFSGVFANMSVKLRDFLDADLCFALSENPRKANPEMLLDKKQVFLVCKDEDLERYSSFINMVISQVFMTLLKQKEGADNTLVIIDEMQRITSSNGKIPYYNNGVLLVGRSKGINTICAIQSIEGLQESYSKPEIQSMIQNTDLCVLSVKTTETAKLISELAGQFKDKEISYSQSAGRVSKSISYKKKNILEQSELATGLVDKGEIVLITSKYGYLRADKCSYFNDPILGPMSKEIQDYNDELEGLLSDSSVKEIVEEKISVKPLTRNFAAYIIEDFQKDWRDFKVFYKRTKKRILNTTKKKKG